MGSAGGGLQRPYVDTVPAQAEVSFSRPGKGAVILQSSVGLAKQNIAVIGSTEQGIAHVRGDAAGREIKRDYPVSPNEFAVANFQTADGEREKLLDRFLARNLFHLWLRLVGAAVRIKNDVDSGMIENHIVEPNVSPQDRPDLHLGHQAVHVSVGNFSGLFATVDG